MSSVLIIGRDGVSGRAAARLAGLLGYQALALNDEDFSQDLDLNRFDLIVTSPGVKPLRSALWQAAKKHAEQKKCRFISEMEFGFLHWRNPLAAITGTNGKTTTTELTAALLRATGIPAFEAGNIGRPLADLAAEKISGNLPQNAVAVVEVSSFQLELCETFAPDAALLLNLESDHVDRYAGGMEEYAAVKMSIFDRVPEPHRIFGLSMKRGATRVTVADGLLTADGRALLPLAETALDAGHNRENLAGAVELCLRVAPEKVFTPEFAAAIRAFRPGRHRFERLGTRDGVSYVNDSKATNPAAVIAALRQISGGKSVILLGGLDKDMDFSTLAAFAPRIRAAVLYGQCRAKIAAALDGAVELHDCGMDFEAAVKCAVSQARPGDTVLLAPGCASMDMFKNYIERGDSFAALCGFARVPQT